MKRTKQMQKRFNKTAVACWRSTAKSKPSNGNGFGIYGQNYMVIPDKSSEDKKRGTINMK